MAKCPPGSCPTCWPNTTRPPRPGVWATRIERAPLNFFAPPDRRLGRSNPAYLAILLTRPGASQFLASQSRSVRHLARRRARAPGSSPSWAARCRPLRQAGRLTLQLCKKLRCALILILIVILIVIEFDGC